MSLLVHGRIAPLFLLLLRLF